jgi:hypothetical protein
MGHIVQEGDGSDRVWYALEKREIAIMLGRRHAKKKKVPRPTTYSYWETFGWMDEAEKQEWALTGKEFKKGFLDAPTSLTLILDARRSAQILQHFPASPFVS